MAQLSDSIIKQIHEQMKEIQINIANNFQKSERDIKSFILLITRRIHHIITTIASVTELIDDFVVLIHTLFQRLTQME